MAHYMTHPSDSNGDAEYASNKPVNCSNCSVEMDADDDKVEEVDDQPYCSACAPEARTKAYAAIITAELPEKLSEVMVWMEETQTEQKPDENCDPHDGYAMLDDMKARVERSVRYPGRDTGWRDGLMMSNEEASDVIGALERMVTSQAIHIKVYSDTMAKNGKSADQYRLGAQAIELVRLARQVETLKAARTRTRYGVGVSF